MLVKNAKTAPVVLAMLGAMLLTLAMVLALSRPASAAETLVVDKTVTVHESDFDVDTGVDVRTGDRLVVSASGQIWAGVWFTGNNGPQGWNDLDCAPKFPLPCSHPYALLGKLNGNYFYIGSGINQVNNAGTSRLSLRINDDLPGNGNGSFTAHIQVFRNVTPPPNNNFSAATSVPFAEQTVQKLSADTTLATIEYGEPRPYGGTKDCGIYGISNSVWYKFTPATTVYAYDSRFSTYGSNFDTVLGLYTGSSLTSLQQVACSNNNAYPNTSPYTDNMRAKLVAGKTYYLQVSGTGGKRSGNLKLEIQAGCVYRTSTSLSPACYL